MEQVNSFRVSNQITHDKLELKSKEGLGDGPFDKMLTDKLEELISVPQGHM